jgi:hypothetical protein
MNSFSRCRSWYDTIFTWASSHSLGKSGLWNKIHMSRVSNDYVYQSASTIYCKHNIHLSPWWLEIWCWKNMCLFVHNMQPNIPSNGGKKSRITSCVVMCSPPWLLKSWIIQIEVKWPFKLYINKQNLQITNWRYKIYDRYLFATIVTSRRRGF